MSTRSERAARKTSDSPLDRLRRGECPNCGHGGSHYVPPSMGESGFFACDSFCETCRIEKERAEVSTNTQVTPYDKCCCAKCGPPWRDEIPEPDKYDFASWLGWHSWMALCPKCGNKRCPGAADHDNPCSGSNEPGQIGSLYPPIDVSSIVSINDIGKVTDA